MEGESTSEELSVDRKLIEECLKQLEQNKKVFSREAQFQFELAWVIKEKLNNKQIEVVLEFLVKSVNNSSPLEDDEEHQGKEKKYIDIVIFDKRVKRCYPIELKYKTASKEYTYKVGDILMPTSNQGAPDIGSYDFIKDIKRIEDLLCKKLYFQGVDYTVAKGFAVIISNDENYYHSFEERKKTNNQIKKENGKYYHDYKGEKKFYYWQDFSLSPEPKTKKVFNWINPQDGEIIDIQWVKGIKSIGKDRVENIVLKNMYSFDWREYNIDGLSGGPNLMYMIVDVPPQFDAIPDNEVNELATKLMDEFDEAFKELAK